MSDNRDLLLKLDKLDQHLYKSIALAQDVLLASQLKADMQIVLDAHYQSNISRLYNFIKDAVNLKQKGVANENV